MTLLIDLWWESTHMLGYVRHLLAFCKPYNKRYEIHVFHDKQLKFPVRLTYEKSSKKTNISIEKRKLEMVGFFNLTITEINTGKLSFSL